MSSDDLEKIESEDSERHYFIEHYLHGCCHEWVMNNMQYGDVAVVILQNDYETNIKFLLHCFILRNNKYFDVRGKTDNLEDILEEFDEGEDDIYIESNSIHSFEKFIKNFLNGGKYSVDYEDAILEWQESEAEDCSSCPYKGEKCRSQCMEVQEIYNPVIQQFLEKCKVSH